MLRETTKREAYKDLVEAYKLDSEPINVSIRDLAGDDYNQGSLHKIHPYPAKLLPQIPYFFMQAGILPEHGTILDPFCGTGTTLLEAKHSSARLYGADANPLARLITNVKLSGNLPTGLKSTLNSLELGVKRIKLKQSSSALLARWFNPAHLNELNYLVKKIKLLDDRCLREFLLVCLSACLKELSYADPRVSVPVKLHTETYPEGHWYREKALRRLMELEFLSPMELLKKKADNYFRYKSDSFKNEKIPPSIIFDDAKSLKYPASARKLSKNSLDLVFTSPPYGTAQKYIRSSALSLALLGLVSEDKLADLDRTTIGSEKLCFQKASTLIPKTGVRAADSLIKRVADTNSRRAFLSASYLIGMRSFMAESIRVLRNGGHLAIVIGNNLVCGRNFETSDYLREIGEQLGLKLDVHLVDLIKSRGLMTRRNSSSGIIAAEHILIFKK